MTTDTWSLHLAGVPEVAVYRSSNLIYRLHSSSSPDTATTYPNTYRGENQDGELVVFNTILGGCLYSG